LGKDYWDVVNPVFYYWDRPVERPTQSLEEAVAKARAHPGGDLLVDNRLLRDLEAAQVKFTLQARGKSWVWVRLQDSKVKP
jgi:hypothetical protein